ncbi:MAG: 2-amino-4-hydroxy-6-hydroxymethyldihydropteridine diphosphokinase [Tannerella sp.]|jgi:2-amino-4-hydroxy-6-hydroxymethyldihydropteridine diphosphokinase|nr:2-amino-4-hydroxy-6-hydroxymethyldihydropteridine diphosphokinase [Tannerella sp.]
MAVTYLSLGSNLGNRRRQLMTAVALLAERAGKILALSGFYETEPWGYDSPHVFLNMAVQLETALPPLELLSETQRIEQELGRTAKSDGASYQDRLIDIDILLYDKIVQMYPGGLVLPHPRMHQRLFVLQPLAEIAPALQHPALQQTVTELLEGLNGRAGGRVV